MRRCWRGGYLERGVGVGGRPQIPVEKGERENKNIVNKSCWCGFLVFCVLLCINLITCIYGCDAIAFLFTHASRLLA